MRLPLERLWPTGHRWLQLLHLDHLIDLNSNIRIMLLLSCVISLSYSAAWLMDVIQLSCFTNTPWKEECIGRWTCLFYFVGGIVLAFMFQHSAMALAYYDEDGERLRERKERFLGEMQKQTSHVLARATNQAQRLCGLLSADLGDKVDEHVFRMQRILKKIEREQDEEARRTYEELATQMAHHLHSLRQPALSHFEKLMKLSGKTRALKDALRRERHQSMVQLLTGRTGSVPRTATGHGDEEEGFLQRVEEIVGSRSAHDVFCFGCCFPQSDLADAPQAAQPLQRTSSIDATFRVPTGDDMQEHLRPIGLEEQQRHPQRVVLRPLRLVLKWFEKIEPKRDQPGRVRSAIGDATGLAMREVRSVTDKVMAVWLHLRRSAFYRCVLFGIVCSLLLFAFYFHMFFVCIDVMRKGECHGQLIVSCFMAMLRKVVGMFAMACYATALSVVLWNVERLDAVLQVQEEIHELEDFKRQVDRLNAHELAEDDSDVSIIQSVEGNLAHQKRLVIAFFEGAFGESVPLSAFQRLAADLKAALDSQAGGGDGGVVSVGISGRQAYRRLPEEASGGLLTDSG
mmetsp:Transcript_46495/g.133911  ORF Transcript_46495/g.133911 Transcript_46495/m.133911 type:complete len:570 (-) Transcript_46495:46-1755(-)